MPPLVLLMLKMLIILPGCVRGLRTSESFYVLRWERLKDKSRWVLSHFSGSGSLFVFDGQTFDLDYVKVVISNNTKKYPRHKDITRDPQRQGGNIKLDAGKMRRVNHIKYNGAIPDLLFRNIMWWDIIPPLLLSNFSYFPLNYSFSLPSWGEKLVCLTPTTRLNDNEISVIFSYVWVKMCIVSSVGW